MYKIKTNKMIIFYFLILFFLAYLFHFVIYS